MSRLLGATRHPGGARSLAKIRHLSKAPIVEAIIDVRVTVSPDFRAEVFASIKDELRPEFPIVDERRGVSLAWVFDAAAQAPAVGGPQLQDHGLNGFFFSSETPKEVAQFRVDGFTLNRLAPYSSWKDLLPRALGLLEVYLRVSKPVAITRVATRYINRLLLPTPNLSDYLKQPPRGIPGVEGELRGFVETASVTDRDGTTVNLAKALELVPEPTARVVLLDIDAFKQESLEPALDAIESRLAALHDIKNRVFFDSLTEKAATLLE
jgi:uncharacterized protein (TIGR04255 family)